MVFFVSLEQRQAEMAYSQVGSTVLRDSQERPIEVLVGYLGDDGEFKLVDG